MRSHSRHQHEEAEEQYKCPVDLWGVFLLVNYMVFALAVHPVMLLQTAEAVKSNARGKASYEDPDASSSDYQSAQRFFRPANVNQENQLPAPQEPEVLALLDLPQPGDAEVDNAHFVNDVGAEVKINDGHGGEDGDNVNACDAPLPLHPKKKSKSAITMKNAKSWVIRWPFLSFDLKKQKMKCKVKYFFLIIINFLN